ncbi:MAG: IclR family transcriptional regulator [Pseudonocardiaceae bacterium]|nr:MAG: IclR family transcriptional regulator [Pseudonocardiaceae bacterium]
MSTPVLGPTTARSRESMGGLAKGLMIMEAFAAHCGALTIAEAAVASQTTRAAARRCLRTLLELGYVTHDGKYYRPAARMLQLGAVYDAHDPLPRNASEQIIRAREGLEEALSVAVWADGNALFVARQDAMSAAVASVGGVRVGMRLPAFCSATGRVLLAAQSDTAVNRYLADCERSAYTSRTVVDRDNLRALVREARDRGYATNDEELREGLRSLAVPVRAHGKTIAALSATIGRRERVDEARERIVPLLTSAAADVTVALEGCA